MTINKLTDEQVENIAEMAANAAKRFGPQWDSALVGSPGGNFHAVTSDTIQDVIVQANDDSRDSSWLCDYLEAVSPATILAVMRELQEYRKAASEPIAWINEDELPEGYPYDVMFPFSKVDIVRLFPMYAPLSKPERAELQEYQKAETADREMLKRLAVILSGSDAPGEIKALTVTAQSFVDRCKLLSRERDALRNTAGNSHEPSNR